jgi:hypothetical protein
MDANGRYNTDFPFVQLHEEARCFPKYLGLTATREGDTSPISVPPEPFLRKPLRLFVGRHVLRFADTTSRSKEDLVRVELLPSREGLLVKEMSKRTRSARNPFKSRLDVRFRVCDLSYSGCCRRSVVPKGRSRCPQLRHRLMIEPTFHRS